MCNRLLTRHLFYCCVIFLSVLVIPNSSILAQSSFEDQIKSYDRDDIHSIHKRLFTKVGRHEVSVNSGLIFGSNDGYALFTGQYQYHFFESLGFEAAAGGFGFQFGDDEKLAFYQASLSFSPIYGKISWFTWAVLNFDLYTIAGAGVANYSGVTSGSAFMGNVGGGIRLFITEWLSSKIELRDYIFDRKGVNDSSITHNWGLTAGLSVLIPFSQDL